MNRLLASAALLLCTCASAAAADWTVQQADSSLDFAGTSQGERFEGTFTQFDAQIRFDPAALEQARFAVEVRLDSVDSRNTERDETLRGPDFFDVERQPVALYRATRFRAEGEGFVADGELTLNGVTRKVPLRFSWSGDAEGALLQGQADLDRLAFGIGDGDWADPEAIAHAVQVSTRLTLVPAGG